MAGKPKTIAEYLAALSEDKRAALEKKPTAPGWFGLARWCQAKELWVASTDCLKQALVLDPEDRLPHVSAAVRVPLGRHALHLRGSRARPGARPVSYPARMRAGER